MGFLATGRLLRMVRIRRGLRQSDVAARAQLSDSAVGRHEQGAISSIRALERHAASLDLRVEVRLAGRSGQLARLLDEEHAALVELTASDLKSLGFAVVPEASFSQWGDRGRVDLLARHAVTGTIVVVEAKTLLLDLQDLFGSLDVKERLAPTVARSQGWATGNVVTILVMAGTRRNREVVASHPTLCASMPVRRMGAWMATGRGRALVWVGPRRTARGRWLAGRQRVRR